MAGTADERARLEAQRAYFASDQRIRERAAMWADASPEECLEAVREACETAMRLLSLKSEAELEAALRPDPLPPDTLAILGALQQRRR